MPDRPGPLLMKDRNGCAHTESEIRWKVCSNGTRQYWRQCLGCGQLLGTPLPAAMGAKATRAVDEGARQQGVQAYLRDIREARATIKADRREEYSSYLQSAEWRAKRAKVLARAKGICEGCGDRRATQVHHLTYAHIRDELLFELVAVCDGCHEKIHPHMAEAARA